ncbi:heme exporter protein CcmD [Myxococcus sp. CA051A]|uniref:Heme exporter protein CcmD n=1 Tax=Myxococcus llanfairpwllgwyngyllgogerychwyrndrobwllllantysiliogogogochensis TaxID=2590453 RepID=A0A540X1G6_9BACT|nr:MULTISPECIES: heme exporter protein CcmD [Myxococcus]NTX07925.1 heme exporter protein CcmD [Myxococcus sp. CA040A]NTX14844.1 heme exporter protein CcmD [Myxococcus sp. CA056]NTX40658.1 heme exporter protein CcmD [Myxococcus sp. CA033]NTX52637.1 heme exporter protein CcmD [Myxococcus sp. CA039A]NTX66678.1 heme exporter protein CcmD [Myxococcus sp. CA051A]
MTTLTTLGVLAQAAGQVGSGRIQGGWGYVWACYGITVVALVLYSLSLWLRRPQAAKE